MGENNDGRQNMLGSDTHSGPQSVAKKSDHLLYLWLWRGRWTKQGLQT